MLLKGHAAVLLRQRSEGSTRHGLESAKIMDTVVALRKVVSDGNVPVAPLRLSILGKLSVLALLAAGLAGCTELHSLTTSTPTTTVTTTGSGDEMKDLLTEMRTPAPPPT